MLHVYLEGIASKDIHRRRRVNPGPLSWVLGIRRRVNIEMMLLPPVTTVSK